MLEDTPVGICDSCGYRYYHSTIMKRVEGIAEGLHASKRTETIPVAHY
ncbi:MAG: hypothetical protein ACE5GV_14825 [Candidatus Scalindua sp.]